MRRTCILYTVATPWPAQSPIVNLQCHRLWREKAPPQSHTQESKHPSFRKGGGKTFTFQLQRAVYERIEDTNITCWSGPFPHALCSSVQGNVPEKSWVKVLLVFPAKCTTGVTLQHFYTLSYLDFGCDPWCNSGRLHSVSCLGAPPEGSFKALSSGGPHSSIPEG